MKTLKEAKIGETVTVLKLHGEGAIKRRIMDMGITKGVQIHVRKVAPLGDPIEITVRGYELSQKSRCGFHRSGIIPTIGRVPLFGAQRLAFANTRTPFAKTRSASRL